MALTAKPLQIFDKTFIEIFRDYSAISPIILCPLLIFIGCHGNQNAKKKKKRKRKKNYLLKNHMLYESETL